MSLEILRHDAITQRRHDLTHRARSVSSQTAALRSITNLISRNAGLSTLINTSFDTENTPPSNSEDSSWLKSNDIASGRYFDESTIPFPTLTQDDDTIYASKPNRHSTKPLGTEHATSRPDVPTGDDIVSPVVEANTHHEPSSSLDEQQTSRARRELSRDEAPSITYAEKALSEPDGPTVAPDEVAEPQPDEEANFTGETQQLLDDEKPARPAKVVHLPPEDVQDKRMHELEEERRRRKSEDADQAKASRAHLQAQAELASSPSSTVGAYSAATPVPPQDSPDTSPDSENAEQDDVLPPKDMRPSPEEQRAKEEHDRLLEAQKAIARREALGDVSTPDDQLKWEEREAAARDAEEKAAREEVNGPEPDAKDEAEETQAEEVMEDVEHEKDVQQVEQLDSNLESKAESQISQVNGSNAQDEDDNITVAPRNKAALTIDTTRLQQRASELNREAINGDQARMTTRTSSGNLQKRSVSEVLGETPQSGHSLRRDLLSPDNMSPMNARHPHDTTVAGPSNAPSSTSRRPPRPSGVVRIPSNPQSELDQLIPLKGAAEDPNRDYLEPLFRIQAHDTQNRTGSVSLPELIKSSSKTLSTEDHFTNYQERTDYKILRRVYQLQNANKWSLRQMERCKEPEQPVTHHDHMMAEMQWMRKDFKAERKMKRSVCAWLAQRCAEWHAASTEERKKLQIQVKPAKQNQRRSQSNEEQIPQLDHSGESAAEEDTEPLTPHIDGGMASTLVVPPELSDAVAALQKSGKLIKALDTLPVSGLSEYTNRALTKALLTPASKFVQGKILPKSQKQKKKRSRYDYEDDAELLEDQPEAKRLREERDWPPEDTVNALFHPDNKHLRDRLHANNTFRPPSEFAMPSGPFYEYRAGSQWLWEDDQKLRKLAKDYSFNWSLIADEMQLPGIFKSSAERRTPWECFERWEELEQLPTEMKKTIYFKTWYQRLEQSQQASERRYQATVAALQAQNNGNAAHFPRRRTVPTRVDKRRNTRYLWLVDAMRKLARKKESQAYKAAEAQRAAAQRKTQTDNNQQRAAILTPQEFSKKRYERDVQIAEAQRQHRLKVMEATQRQVMASRQLQQQQQQGMQQGAPNQQRPGSSSNMPAQQAQMQANGQQQQVNMNGQLPQQARPQVPMATRNGHLAVPQVNGQGIPQAQMQPNGQMTNAQQMQRLAQAQAQARGQQYAGQQQYPIQNAHMATNGTNGMTPQQQLQNSQAMLANAMQQQMNNAVLQQNASQTGVSNQMASASPSMPPPPTPQHQPQQLSSGQVPAILNIKAQLRAKYPGYTDEQISGVATEILKNQSHTTNQARQSAMNAATGINGGVAPQSHGNNLQAYAHNQAAFQNANQMPNGNTYMNGDGSVQQPASMSPASQQQYAALLRQRQMQQMRMQQSPNSTHATLNGSPGMAHASPNMTPVSPNMQYSNINQMAAMNNMASMNNQRPPSRSATPQQRLGSSGSVPGLNGLPSPQGVNGLQGSPRNMQASLAR